MPHGYPDYGVGAPASTIYPMLDIGELAARLGSIVTFDRRGNVIFLENFDGSLSKLCTDTEGIGGSIAISNEKARHGNFSCKMVTGNTEDDYADLGVDVAYPILSKIGVEVCWALPADSNIKVIDLSMDLFDGVKDWQPWVKWVRLDSTWYYYNGSDWVPLSPPVVYYEGATLFNHTKLVADFVNKKYVRLIANNQVYDLSDIALPIPPGTEDPHLGMDCFTYTRGDGVCTVFLDSLIITQNEP